MSVAECPEPSDEDAATFNYSVAEWFEIRHSIGKPMPIKAKARLVQSAREYLYEMATSQERAAEICELKKNGSRISRGDANGETMTTIQ